MIWGNELVKFSYRSNDLNGNLQGNTHQHNGIEFLLINEGFGRVLFNHRIYHVEPRTLVFFKPNQPHHIMLNKPFRRSGAKLRVLLPDPLMQYFPSLNEFVKDVNNSSISQMYSLNERQYEDLEFYFHRFYESLPSIPDAHRQESFLLFMLQVVAYFKFYIFSETSPSDINVDIETPSDHITVILDWLERNFRRTFDLNELADAVHLSPNYISRLFRQQTGETLTQYLMIRRLNEACVLLNTTSFSIRQVANCVGFSNSAYFCRCFKKKYTISPQQFRHRT